MHLTRKARINFKKLITIKIQSWPSTFWPEQLRLAVSWWVYWRPAELPATAGPVDSINVFLLKSGLENIQSHWLCLIDFSPLCVSKCICTPSWAKPAAAGAVEAVDPINVFLLPGSPYTTHRFFSCSRCDLRFSIHNLRLQPPSPVWELAAVLRNLDTTHTHRAV